MANCFCLIVSTDGRLVGVNLTLTGRFFVSLPAYLSLARANLGCVSSNLGLASPNLGCVPAYLGLAQPIIGCAQAYLGLAQPNLGIAQANFAEHKIKRINEGH